MKLESDGTPDCCGKQSCDNEVASVSLRYYPRGGGFFTLDAGINELKGNETRPNIPPSISGSVWIGDEQIVETEFDAETEAEVKAQAEAWAKTQYDRIVTAIRSEYK